MAPSVTNYTPRMQTTARKTMSRSPRRLGAANWRAAPLSVTTRSTVAWRMHAHGLRNAPEMKNRSTCSETALETVVPGRLAMKSRPNRELCPVYKLCDLVGLDLGASMLQRPPVLTNCCKNYSPVAKTGTATLLWSFPGVMLSVSPGYSCLIVSRGYKALFVNDYAHCFCNAQLMQHS